MEGNLFTKLKIDQVDEKQIGSIKNNVFKTFNTVLLKTRPSFVAIALGLLINLVNMLSTLFSMAPTLNWRFEVFFVIREYMRFTNIEILLKLHSMTLNCILLLVVFLYHLCLLGYILFFRKKVSPTLQLWVSRYLMFYYSFINTALSVSLYLLFISQIYCKNADYNLVCWSGWQFVNLTLAVGCLILHIVLVVMGVLYCHIVNPAVDVLFNGSSKIYMALIEIERLAYGLYALIRVDESSDKQFLIFMTLVCLVKIYEKFVLDPFYDIILHRIFVCIEGIQFYMIVSVVLVVFVESDTKNPISFITSIMGAAFFGIAYQFFIENRFFGKYERLRKRDVNDTEVTELSTLFISCLHNVRHGAKYRRMLQRIVFEKRIKCKNSGASMLKGLDFLGEKQQSLVRKLGQFWKGELEEYLEKTPNNMTLLLHRLYLSLLYTNEIYSILQFYRKLEVIEGNFLKEFEVFMLKKALRVKIKMSNGTACRVKHDAYLRSLLLGHNIADRAQREMEGLLRRLFGLWEDVSITPLKYLTNLGAAYNLFIEIMNLRTRVEELLRVHQDEKLLRVYISFMKLIGFPTASLQRGLTKIKLKNTDRLLDKYQERRVGSFDINDRKIALILPNLHRDGNGTVAYASHTIKDVINLDACNLKDANIKAIMPECYKRIHQNIVSDYFVKCDKSNNKSSIFPIFTLDEENFLRISMAFVKIYPYVCSSVRMVG
jgi:hypothetical protein